VGEETSLLALVAMYHRLYIELLVSLSVRGKKGKECMDIIDNHPVFRIMDKILDGFYNLDTTVAETYRKIRRQLPEELKQKYCK